MNNQLDKSTNGLTQSVTRAAQLLGVGLALLVGLAVVVSGVSGENASNRLSGRIALTGHSDWSIVPANLAPQFVFIGTDGNFYVRHLPLVGRLNLAGLGVSIEGKIHADFNGELNSAFSGPVWAPVTITGAVNGHNTILFEGNATGDTVVLVSVGVMRLEGRGPFAGDNLELEFTEIGPGNTDIYDLKGVLLRRGP